MEDYFGNELKIGNVIIIPTHCHFTKHIVLGIVEKSSRLKLSRKVNMKLNWRKDDVLIFAEESKCLSNHNSFVYRQFYKTNIDKYNFIIIDEEYDFSIFDNIKSNKKLKAEFMLNENIVNK
jgi:hypothetical protein